MTIINFSREYVIKRNGEGRTCNNFFGSRLRLSSTLQFGIGWDEQNGLSQGIYTQLALISHAQHAQSILLAYVIKLEKHNLTDQKVH